MPKRYFTQSKIYFRDLPRFKEDKSYTSFASRLKNLLSRLFS